MRRMPLPDDPPDATGALHGASLVPGSASGAVAFAPVGLSFMGGVDPATGVVIDVHHPLRGTSIAGAVVALPSGRGSCAGSLAIFELLMNGHAPSALVFEHEEPILTLGVMIALELFERGIPVVRLDGPQFAQLESAAFATVEDGVVVPAALPPPTKPAHAYLPALNCEGFELTERDRRMLAGDEGEAAQLALRLTVRAAQLQGSNGLVDVDMAHIDGCFYHGPATLLFARRLCELGARVAVPATMNALCVDVRRWQEQAVPAGLGQPSCDLADAYAAMGVRPTFTCAPYLLDGAPRAGQQVAWAESNAVAFANSVIGARTLKYPDYLDILVAITGRAPRAGCHVTEERHATLRVDVAVPDDVDDSFFPLLGYALGGVSPNDIPVVCGLERLSITSDDLKAMSAAFATTSSAPMFHIVGVTPEAPTFAAAVGGNHEVRRSAITADDLRAARNELNTATDPSVELVALGNPHLSLTELARVAELCQGRTKSADVELMLTCAREISEKADAAGLTQPIRDFGGVIINDTCWCLITEPVVAPTVRNIMTNSAKYAHYGPASLRRGFHFASLGACIDAACSGRVADSALRA